MDDAHTTMPIAYRLKTVRIGLQATWLAVAGLTIYPFLPGADPVRLIPFFGAVVAAAAGAGVVTALPWERLFRSGRGIAFLYAWSVADIILVTVVLAASGGARSDLFGLYALTTIFFAISYPRRGQQALLGFTVGCYLVLFATTSPMRPGESFARLTLLGILAFLASFLSKELANHVVKASRARAESDRRADLLAITAHAAHAMSTLDPEHVLDVVVDSAIALGFEAAEIAVFDEATGTSRSVHPRHLPDTYVEAVYPATAGIAGLARSRRETVTIDYSSFEGAVPELRHDGYRSVIASPVRTQGEIVAALVAGSKIDRPINAQEIEAFELLAAQAGAALENARAFAAQRRTVERMAELDKMKDDFLSTVSHELRTPLTAVGVAGQLLELRWEELDESLRRQILSRLNANSKTLESIIETLLDFSKFDSGHPPVHAARIDLGPVIDATVARVSGLFSERKLVVRADGDLVVDADPLLIDRVIENLLANAAKHTPKQSRVELSARRRDSHVVVTVSDNGNGIPPEEIAHLSERFYRGAAANEQRVRGIGLGLALVREILDLHGAELEIESETAKGARFSFRLPVPRTARQREPSVAHR